MWAYVAWYTLGRVWIEALRIDDAEMVTLFGVTARLNVWTSLLLLLVAVGMLALILARHRGAAVGPRAHDPVWLPGHGPAGPVTADLGDGTADARALDDVGRRTR